MPLTVAIGPRTKYPSWNWVGEDTAAVLRKHFTVTVFEHDRLPDADAFLIVKRPQSARRVQTLKLSGARMIYLPIDYFESETHIEREQEFLSHCDMIGVHSDSLGRYLQRFSPVRSIDHHGKYTLDEVAPFKASGFAVWIGAMEHLPHLLQFLDHHPLEIETRILTNLDCSRAVVRAKQIAEELQVSMRITTDTINGFVACPWNPALQTRMLREAKAAIDMKGDSFNQRHKPPTKAQKFVCSGLPLAMNEGESVRYFVRHGLNVPSPLNPHWLSREYYDETCSVARCLRPMLTLHAIGERYRELIAEVMSAS